MNFNLSAAIVALCVGFAAIAYGKVLDAHPSRDAAPQCAPTAPVYTPHRIKAA